MFCKAVQFRVILVSLILLQLLAVGCGGDGELTDPSSPKVAQIVLTSPVDTLIDLDGTVQLTATASDAQGRAITVDEFVWQSSDASVATVTSSGLVKPAAVGHVLISAKSGGAMGTLNLRIVQAELARISALLDDPFTDSLIIHLSSSTKTTIQDALEQSAGGLSTGNLVEVVEGFETAQDATTIVADPEEVPLAGVLALILDHAIRLLNL